MENFYFSIIGKDCEITIEPRPDYCDRGNWIAKIFPSGKLALDMDHQDAWPRYYFYLPFAFSECTAWLKKRKQFIEKNQWERKIYGNEGMAI